MGEVEKIYELLCLNGFDSTKIDHDGRNLIEAMIFQKQYSDLQIERFKKCLMLIYVKKNKLNLV